MDCGLFAIAFAYELANGNDPLEVSFDQRKMHQHLVHCLEKGRLEAFQLNTARFNKRQTYDIDLLCYCSMPECWDNILQCELCEEWLHMTCEGLKTALEGRVAL